ncbi:hypothetical protein H310_02293 [Aphanomyces invadans]|uniref:Uncharacterized protein n=1 Tax=Aphanomyces invadans TaxID=157072 RepID=A0A024UNX4_9STRA|nr:hypothetical protein H310_02293 [Aphanomyces invadans]ETW07875.1 hypothetical protein H310_02293 [Aphanomyces invadans]|eukprot:XP_008863968.1 hypothetical protein H310_02293 [Aphanomyces invadans]
MTEPRLVALGRRRHAWCHGQWPIRNHLRTDATFCSQESDHSDQHFAIHNLMRRLSKRATAQMLVDLVAHPDPRHHLVHRPLFRSMAPKIAVPQKLVHISNDPDYTHMSVDVFQNTGFAIGASHFIHSLQGAGKYEILEVYGHKDKTFTTSVVQFGVNLCGHEGVGTMLLVAPGVGMTWVHGSAWGVHRHRHRRALSVDCVLDNRAHWVHGQSERQLPTSIARRAPRHPHGRVRKERRTKAIHEGETRGWRRTPLHGSHDPLLTAQGRCRSRRSLTNSIEPDCTTPTNMSI